MEVEESGSKRWPPRGKLLRLITDRSRPSEHLESDRDCGGLLSSTRNTERSRGACKGGGGLGVATGFTSGMQDEGFTSMVGCSKTCGRSLEIGKEIDGWNEAGDPGRSGGCTSKVLEGGFSCMGCWCIVVCSRIGVWSNEACKGGACGMVSEVFSCKLASESGGGAVRSKVVAAQSQWVDRDP